VKNALLLLRFKIFLRYELELERDNMTKIAIKEPRIAGR